MKTWVQTPEPRERYSMCACHSTTGEVEADGPLSFRPASLVKFVNSRFGLEK